MKLMNKEHIRFIASFLFFKHNENKVINNIKAIMKNKLLFYLCSTIFITSCATTSKDIYLQSGQKGIQISCHSSDIDSCYSKAGEQCKERGYNIISRSEKNSNSKLVIACR